jgi:hypothetical protein
MKTVAQAMSAAALAESEETAARYANYPAPPAERRALLGHIAFCQQVIRRLERAMETNDLGHPTLVDDVALTVDVRLALGEEIITPPDEGGDDDAFFQHDRGL